VNPWQSSVRWPDTDSPCLSVGKRVAIDGSWDRIFVGSSSGEKSPVWNHQGLLRAGTERTLPGADAAIPLSPFPRCRIIFLVLAHCFLTFLVAAFLIIVFNTGFCSPAATGMSLASWAANRALNLLRASSVEFNVCFFLCHSMRPGSV
jgi:hypothetical protein